MKRQFLTLLLFICCTVLAAQSIESINAEQIHTKKTGMIVLGSWAVANIAISPILASRSSGSLKYFHQMNGLWNTVNLGLSVVSLLTLQNGIVDNYNDLLSEQGKLERLLLFNAGLDVGYIMTGFFLKERSKNVTNNSDRLLGFGQSLILQGGFLFLFDIGFYLLYHQHMSDILGLTENLKLSFVPTGFALTFRL